ncbi:MAG: dTMP kinase [Spirochaetes bacterium]|jgi:dTMP kinase|nr:dTMP kinase [Spirochaetota bacterium]
MNGTPRFIVLEGIDGSGKSTQAADLHSFLVSSGIDSIHLAEPTGGKWGSEIRRMLKNGGPVPAGEQLRLFLLDRQDDAEFNIIPAMREGKWVVMDRYYFSNAAYQGAAGLDPMSVLKENRDRGFPEPDRVYYIDITPEEALSRVTARNAGGAELFEKKSFLEAVRGFYLSMIDERFMMVNGSLQRGEVLDIITGDLKKRFLS